MRKVIYFPLLAGSVFLIGLFFLRVGNQQPVEPQALAESSGTHAPSRALSAHGPSARDSDPAPPYTRPAEPKRTAADLIPPFQQALQDQREKYPLVLHQHRDSGIRLPVHPRWADSQTISVSHSHPDADAVFRRVTLVEPVGLPYVVRVEEMIHAHPEDAARWADTPEAMTPRHVELMAEELADLVIVRLAEDISEELFYQTLGRMGAEPARVLSHRLQAHRIRLPELSPDGAPDAVQALAEIGAGLRSLSTVETDPIVWAMDMLEPNDPDFVNGSLWGMLNIRGPQGWALQNTAEDVIIGVIDTGVNYNHPDLAANMWVNPQTGRYPGISGDLHGINAITMSGSPMDDQGHGTHVAGTIAAVGNNHTGVVGVAWGAQIMGLKFLSAQGGGTIGDAITCLDYALQMGAHITNNSWGGGAPNQTLLDLIRHARDENQLFIAAAGNSSNNNDINPIFPASYAVDNVVAVSAINAAENLASFSTFGPSSVLLAAPGVDILSTYHTEPWYRFSSGTSMAAPHVAGAAALLLQHHDFESYDVIKARLTESARQITGLQGRVITEGTLDLPGALSVEEDGNMRVRVTVRGQGNLPVVFEGDEALLTVSITDLLPVSEATINATASPAGIDGATITFVADSAAPGNYSATYTLPVFPESTAERIMDIDFMITAPGKTTFTDTVSVDIQTRPVNRFLATALELDAVAPGSVTINNTFAEKEAGERNRIAFLRFHRSLWYSWTPASVASVEINTLGSVTASGDAMDTVLAVYTSPVPNPSMEDLVEVAVGGDISMNNFASRVTFDVLEPGTTYFIQTGDAFRPGDLTLNVIPVYGPPIVTEQPPEALTVFEGLPLRMHAFLAGADSLQWFKDGQPLPEGGRYNGTRTPLLVINPAIPSDAGSYTLRGTNAEGFAFTSAATVTVQTPTGLASWNRLEPQPTGNDLSGVAQGSGRTVAVGGEGTLLLREGTSGPWERVSIGTRARLHAVTYHPSEGFMAVGAEGTILRSDDGSRWTTVDSGTGQTLRGVAFNGSRFVAVGGDYLNGILLESSDGQVWTKRTPVDLDAILYAVVWDGSRFVAVGGHWQTQRAVALESSNGLNWLSHNLAGKPTLHALAHNAGTLVAVGGNWITPVALRNTGGALWMDSEIPGKETLYGVAFANNLWLAMGERGSLLTSANGLHWTARNSGTDFALRSATGDGASFLVVGTGGLILGSPDGQAWSILSEGTRNSLEAVTGASSGFLAVGERGQVSYSPDGQNWLERDPPLLQRGLGVAANGSMIVKVGQDGSLLSSTNEGLTWTPRLSVPSTSLEAVAFGNRFVAVGHRGIIYTSSNGTSWTGQTSPTASRLRAVAYNGSVWRAVGQNGVILGSANGLTWSMVAEIPQADLRGLTPLPNGWVAVGEGGRIFRSTDGFDWTEVPSPTVRTLNAVAAENDKVFAVGNNGTLLTSADGWVWEERDPQVSANLLGATARDGLLITVGGMGTILSTVALDIVATPVISPELVGNEDSVTVSLTTATESARIFYTLDGSDPNPSSLLYTGPFLLSNPSTVRARAFKEGMESSGVAERTYFLQGAPFILEPPTPLALALGGSGALSALVSGEQPLFFQWEKATEPDGPWSAVAGADSPVLTFSNAQVADAGYYRLHVTNALDEIVGEPVRVSVWDVPVIATQPVDLTVASGIPASFSVGALGGGPLSYQWLKNGEPIPGATAASYSLSAASLSASGIYSVVVSSPVGSVTSDSAVLTVGLPPRILTQPVSVTKAAGTDALLSVIVSGSEPLSIDWQFRPIGETSFQSLGNATPSLALPNLAESDAGEYRVLVSNLYGSRTSTPALVSVLQAPVITEPPVNRAVILNQSSTFSVTVSGTDPLHFQWLKNGQVIPGARAQTLTLPSVQASDAGAYSVLITNAVGAVHSSAASLTVLFPATITTPPADQFVAVGGSGSFSVSATGTNITYQWQESVGGVWQNLVGQTSSSFAVSSVSKETDHGRSFRVIVDNPYGPPAVSAAATLHVLTTPSITENPASQSIVLGEPATFSVVAEGDEPLSYQWRRNGSNISGATSASFTLPGVTANRDGDVYTVRVSNPVGQVTSAGATLTILYPPAILNEPQSQIAAEGSTVTFSVLADGTPTLTYQWRKDGVELPGENAPTLTLSAVQASDAGTYSVVVTNDYGTALSNDAVLTILQSLDFVHALRITFDGYTESETLHNFPVPIRLNESLIGFNYADVLSPEGADLRFWSSDLEPLVYEIESWDPQGDSYVWVRIPELTQSTFIYASWGDATAAPAPQPPASTWSEHFLATWHLNSHPANTPDSATAGANNSGSLLTSQTTAEPAIVPGVIGGGFQTRNGLTHRVQIQNHSHLAGRDQATFSFWYRRDVSGGPAAEIFAHDRSGINRRIGYYWPGSNHANGIAFYPRVQSGTIDSPDLFSGDLPVDQWHHVAVTQNRTSSNRADFRMYINGEEVATALNRSLSSSDRWILEPNFLIGNSFSNSAPNATLDEMRMASVLRSPAWIRAEYLSMVDPHAFATYGPATQIPNIPIITLVSPTVDAVRLPEGVGMLLQAEVFEPVEESGALTYAWTALTGPGTVSFETPDALSTAVWFTALGEYTLRLQVTNVEDPLLSAQKLITVEVSNEPIGGGGATNWQGHSLGGEGGAFTFDGDTLLLDAPTTTGSLGGATDTAYFVGLPVKGNGTLTARLIQNGSGPGLKDVGTNYHGLMVLHDPTELNTGKFAITPRTRRANGNNDFHAFLRQNPATNSTITQIQTFPTGSAPLNLRIQRTGGTIQGFVQDTSGTWREIHLATLPALAEEVYVGFYVSNWTPGYTATFDQIDFDFEMNAGVNFGPWVSAGENFAAPQGEPVTLAGEVLDDGLPNPPGMVTTEWIQLSGPAISLTEATSLSPQFLPEAVGAYRFRLVAFDGEVKTISDVEITVEPTTATAFDQWLRANGLDHLDPDVATVQKGSRMVTLRQAFLLGENPFDPNDELRIGDLERIPGRPEMRIVFQSLPHRFYEVETSSDLTEGSWFPVDGQNIVGDGQIRVFTVPMPAFEQTRRFYRIQISFPTEAE